MLFVQQRRKSNLWAKTTRQQRQRAIYAFLLSRRYEGLSSLANTMNTGMRSLGGNPKAIAVQFGLWLPLLLTVTDRTSKRPPSMTPPSLPSSFSLLPDSTASNKRTIEQNEISNRLIAMRGCILIEKATPTCIVLVGFPSAARRRGFLPLRAT